MKQDRRYRPKATYCSLNGDLRAAIHCTFSESRARNRLELVKGADRRTTGEGNPVPPT